MTGNLRAAGQKFVALALLAMIVALIVFGAALPAFYRLRDADERIDAAQALINRLQTSASGDAHQLVSAPGIAALYLPGESDAVRLAGLQSVLGDAAKAHNIQLASISTSEAEQRNGVRMLAVRVQLSSDLPRLQKLLYDIEMAHQTLLIDQLSVARAPSGGSNPRSDLNVSLTVLGAAPDKGQPP